MPRLSVYVLSDLHLGGDPIELGVQGDHGFRMCRQGPLAAQFVRALARHPPNTLELVINGDVVDFLAEHSKSGGWAPFHREPTEAIRILNVIAQQREPELFASFKTFLRAGHRLTMILGNHDLELGLPGVRQRLRDMFDANYGQLQFIYDNEAYVIGNAVIEHGNRLDTMNEVDHDGLRRVRVLQSVRADSQRGASFVPPVGSRLVAELLNPLKVRFPFIDLLKPEAEGMVPILLALYPAALLHLPRLFSYGLKGAAKGVVNRLAPAHGGQISAPMSGENMVRDILFRTLGEDDASALLAIAKRNEGYGGAIASAEPSRLSTEVVGRLLTKLVRDDRTFDMAGEANGKYREGARELIGRGFEAVLFGHTHRACREQLVAPNGAKGVYLNSGTWIDLIKVPEASFGDGSGARTVMSRFLSDLGVGSLEPWISRRPSYVRLEIANDGRVDESLLCIYLDEDPRSAANIVQG